MCAPENRKVIAESQSEAAREAGASTGLQPGET